MSNESQCTTSHTDVTCLVTSQTCHIISRPMDATSHSLTSPHLTSPSPDSIHRSSAHILLHCLLSCHLTRLHPSPLLPSTSPHSPLASCFSVHGLLSSPRNNSSSSALTSLLTIIFILLVCCRAIVSMSCTVRNSVYGCLQTNQRMNG